MSPFLGLVLGGFIRVLMGVCGFMTKLIWFYTFFNWVSVGSVKFLLVPEQ